MDGADGEGHWISLAALGVSVLVLIAGYFTRFPVVAAGSAAEMRTTIKELRVEVKALRDEQEWLKNRVRDLTAEVEFWREEFRKVKKVTPYE